MPAQVALGLGVPSASFLVGMAVVVGLPADFFVRAPERRVFLQSHGVLRWTLVLAKNFGPDAFAAWGWRIPFLFSAGLLAVSVFMRLKLTESPAFAKMKEEGEISHAPFTEAFGQWKNLKLVLLAFDGGCLTSDAGVLLLAEIEPRLGIAERLARCLEDPRDPAAVRHSLAEMIRFRALMIACG